jgi:hypothetical protein
MLEYEYPDDLTEDEIFEFVEIYEGEPDFNASQINENGDQEDEGDTPAGMTFFARASNAVRNWRETLDWYKANNTTQQIGFNPDGMCLKVCRTARNIPARYLTAKQAQDATPKEHRVRKIEDLRKGMVLYFDDPKDSNRSGHIVTQIGRVKGFNPKSLDDILVETNSVLSGRVVVVRASYFRKHWGDKFQFGATWLNGVELDVPGRKSLVERFNNGGPVYDLNKLAKAAANGRPKPGEILRRIEEQIRRLPDNRNINNVREFKDEWRETRKIDLSLLDEAVKNGRVGLVKTVRDEIKRLIAALPEE